MRGLWVTFQLNGDKHLNQFQLQATGKQAGQQIAEADATAPPPAINARAQAGYCPTRVGTRSQAEATRKLTAPLPQGLQALPSCHLSAQSSSASFSPFSASRGWALVPGFGSAPSLPDKLHLPLPNTPRMDHVEGQYPQAQMERGEDHSRGDFCTWRIMIRILVWENECTVLVLWRIRRKNKF